MALPLASIAYNIVKDNPSILNTAAKFSTPGLIAAGFGAIGAAGAAGAATITGGRNTMAPTLSSTGRGLIDIPGVDINWSGILPGGEPFIVPEGPTAGWNYGWTANGQVFYRSLDGKYFGTYTKTGAWKTWRAYHPTVFGKKDDPRKLAKVIKRHHGSWKELNKVFGKRVSYVKAGRK